jgi:hypothetical protein
MTILEEMRELQNSYNYATIRFNDLLKELVKYVPQEDKKEKLTLHDVYVRLEYERSLLHANISREAGKLYHRPRTFMTDVQQLVYYYLIDRKYELYYQNKLNNLCQN